MKHGFRILVPTALILVLVCVAVVATTGTAAAEVGVVDGYEADDEFGFEQPLDEDEVDAVVARSMARVEEIREREFEERPNVEIVGQDEVPGREEVERTPEADWNNVVWKALLVIGEDEYANDVIGRTLSGATTGFYEPGNETKESRVALVGEMDEPTLAHELVHAMQDERYNLSSDRFRPPVQDEQMASQGIIEGEAEYVRFVYEERCALEWECYERRSGVGDTDFDGNTGVLLVALQPYSDGPEYVHRLFEEDGWDAVDEKYDDVPTTSSEIIHFEEREAVDIEFDEESFGGWSLYDTGRDGYDVAGEASIFVTFWYQSHTTGYDLDIVDTSGFFSRSGEYIRYDYRSDVSEGWRGDRIYPYHRETDGGNETGFVWLSTWATEEDAERFADAYLAVLDGHGAERVDGATRIVGDASEFRGAYRVARQDENVTVVHAPTTEGLDELRPSVSDAERPTGEPVDARPQPEATPGFGFVAAVVALFSLVVARYGTRLRA